ncbi:methyltransferase domain-containing protein [Planifilum fimeticola]
MTIDFFDPANRLSYASRSASSEWKTLMQSLVDLRGIDAVDIGCGGGIYSRAMAEMGARVTGVDFSGEMLSAARKQQTAQRIRWIQADAADTGLPDSSYDLVLLRAVIHHFSAEKTTEVLLESYRLLRPGGRIIIQDRALEDCRLPGGPGHLRGFLFERFPNLLEEEKRRRPDLHSLERALAETGFHGVKTRRFWETRKIFRDLGELERDFLGRIGRSILHRLSDDELRDLVGFITEGLSRQGVTSSISDRDRWTLWTARKG